MAGRPIVYSWTQVDLAKFVRRKPPLVAGAFTIDDLENLTGLKENAIRKHEIRKNFTPRRIDSVVPFLARFAQDDLREKLVRASVMPSPGRMSNPGTTLAEIATWMVEWGTDEFKHRILRAAMSSGGRKPRKSSKKR